MRPGAGRATVAAGSLAASLLFLGAGEATAGDSVKRASAEQPFTFTTDSGDVTCLFTASATHSTESDRAGGYVQISGQDPFCTEPYNFYAWVEMTFTNLSGRASYAAARGYAGTDLTVDGVAGDVVVRYGTLILRECPPDAACATANYTLTPK